MDISGLIQSQPYDQRTSSSAALTRAIMAPQYATSLPFNGSFNHHQQHNNPFSANPYGGPNSNGLLPVFGNNYIQRRPQVRSMPSTSDGLPRGFSYAQNTRDAFMEVQQSPTVKAEPQTLTSSDGSWNMNGTVPMWSNHDSMLLAGNGEINFGTDVDTLMKAIQSKAQQSSSQPQQNSPVEQSRPVVGGPTPTFNPNSCSQPAAHGYNVQLDEDKKSTLTNEDFQEDKDTPKKRYECDIVGCNKTFYQKTHLEIHVRAHTGVKPYVSLLILKAFRSLRRS